MSHPMRRLTDRRLSQESPAPRAVQATRNPYTVNELGQKVFTITCDETGEVFQHVQTTRGAPPRFSPAVRARRAAVASEPTDRKQAALRKMALLVDTVPQVDQYVMRVTTGMKVENALPWMVPARVIALLEDGRAQVERGDHEVSVVQLDKLIPVQVR
jgi:hypothetical protein